MPTRYLNYKERIIDLRNAEKCAKEEKEKAKKAGDKDAEERWERAEETARIQADRLEEALKQK